MQSLFFNFGFVDAPFLVYPYFPHLKVGVIKIELLRSYSIKIDPVLFFFQFVQIQLAGFRPWFWARTVAVGI
jgi:hypothetical protein